MIFPVIWVIVSGTVTTSIPRKKREKESKQDQNRQQEKLQSKCKIKIITIDVWDR